MDKESPPIADAVETMLEYVNVMSYIRKNIDLHWLAEKCFHTRREVRGLTLAVAAAEIGISEATLSRVEKAKRYQPDLEVLLHILAWLRPHRVKLVGRWVALKRAPAISAVLADLEEKIATDPLLVNRERLVARDLVQVIREIFIRVMKTVAEPNGNDDS